MEGAASKRPVEIRIACFIFFDDIYMFYYLQMYGFLEINVWQIENK